MKHLSFVALVFYLGSLFSPLEASAAHNVLDVLQIKEQHGLSLLTSAAQQVKHADVSADSDKVVVWWHQFRLVAANRLVSPRLIFILRAAVAEGFSARAPPLCLG